MIRRIAAIFLLSVVALILPASSTANNEPSVEGDCDIALEGFPTRHIQFSARTAPNGTTTGEVTVRDASSATSMEAEGGSQDPFFMKAQVDCMVVKGNKVLLTSTVTEASAERYVGGRLMLVAISNGDDGNSSSAGKVTWGFYRKGTRDWVATDSDRAADEVNPTAWVASDFEREDDEAIIKTPDADTTVTCTSFPLSGFTFKEEYYVTGTVRLRP